MLLLERLGEVVTREEFQNRLWPGSTSGDFDRGLNKAINKLRVALAIRLRPLVAAPNLWAPEYFPAWPWRCAVGATALMLYRARRYDESIAHCRKVLEVDPHHVNALWFLALSLEQKGALAEAIAGLESAVSLSGAPHYRAMLGRAYALTGQRTKALTILDELMALSRQTYVSPFDLAVLHLGLGDQTSLFDYLEEAFRQRVWRIIELTTPLFDCLHSHPRWIDLSQRIGLAH